MRKYEFDYEYFHEINCAQKAYWLGFFYADGYITKQGGFGCGISLKDKGHLEKFLQSINISSLDCLEIQEKTNSYRFQLFNKNLYNNLLNLGFTITKSYDQNDLIFKSIPNSFKKDFLRGYWDGDGYVSVSGENKNLTGVVSNNKILLDTIANYINSIFGKDFTKVINTDGYYRIRIYTAKAYRFCEYLYLNSKVHLDRKYNNFLNLKKPIKNKRQYKYIKKLPSNRYYIYIPHNKKPETIGTFNTIQEAIIAFNKKAVEYGVLCQMYINESLEAE